MMSLRLTVWGMTISAPVFCSDIDLHASVISFTAALSIALSSFPRNFPMNLRVLYPRRLPLPNRIRKCRISGWKMMMTASTPTSMSRPTRRTSSMSVNENFRKPNISRGMTIYYSILIRILAFLVIAAGSVGGFCIASAKIVKIC